MAVGWPVVLTDGDVKLRPLRRADQSVWNRLRGENWAWLSPWDSSTPHPEEARRLSFPRFVQQVRKEARQGRGLPFTLEYQRAMVGQVSVSTIVRGAMWSGAIGYWIAQRCAGKGIVPTAVALAVDHCFFTVGLHRIEVPIRPENGPSLRVVEKLGFRDEGIRERYMHINGKWADHRVFAITAEEVPEGVLARWRSVR